MKSILSRRRFLQGTALVSAGTIVAACQPKVEPTAAPAQVATKAPEATKPPEATKAPAAEKVTLQISWWPVGGERGLKAMEDALKPFDEANPNITVERLPTAQGYFDKLMTMFAGGTPPDVCAIDNYDLTSVADKGVLAEMDPLIQADSDFTLEEFFASALIEGVWMGKRYAIPYIGSTRIIFYNIDLMEKAGLETPDKLWERGEWTWDAFLSYATKITDRSGGAATTVFGCADDANFYGGLPPWVWGAKGEILNEDRTKCLLNEENAVAGVQYVQDLMFKHKVAPTAENRKDVDLVATGRVGMWASWRGLSLAYRTFDYKWDVVPFPMGPAGKTTLYKGNSMAIAKDTEHLEQAWTLAKYITGKQADAIYINNGGATPRKDNLDVMMKSSPPQNNQYFYNPLNEGWTKMLPFTPRFRQWNNELQPFLDRIFLDGENVQAVMNEAVVPIDKVLNEA